MWEFHLLKTTTPMSKWMDEASNIMGKHHRDVNHTQEDVMILALTRMNLTTYTFEQLYLAGMLHIFLDELYSEIDVNLKLEPDLDTFKRRKPYGKKTNGTS